MKYYKSNIKHKNIKYTNSSNDVQDVYSAG